jgi:hypothetical protein
LKKVLAAYGITLRGFNVSHCQWTIGAGGVGHSLLATLIHNTFSGLHSYYDTNCYYSDDDFQKQAESLKAKLIVAAQEGVEGSSQGTREDLYKKHITATKLLRWTLGALVNPIR